jgi:glycerophosphoryl diester phosphodiesterase
MRPPFDDPPVLCGHRGSGRGVVDGEAENTLGSYRQAVAAGMRWVEVDVRFTADDVLVASHDPVMADGRFISELPGDGGLMRIADLLEDLPPEVGVNLEVKSSLEDALRPRERTTAALVADLVERSGAGRPLLVSSFDPSAVLIFRERVPEVPVGLLTWTRFPARKAIPAAVHLGADVVALHFASLDFGQKDAPAGERDAGHVVGVAHEAGLQVVTWCPQPAAARKLAAAGVDCLIVDDAPRAVGALAGEPPQAAE